MPFWGTAYFLYKIYNFEKPATKSKQILKFNIKDQTKTQTTKKLNMVFYNRCYNPKQKDGSRKQNYVGETTYLLVFKDAAL